MKMPIGGAPPPKAWNTQASEATSNAKYATAP